MSCVHAPGWRPAHPPGPSGSVMAGILLLGLTCKTTPHTTHSVLVECACRRMQGVPSKGPGSAPVGSGPGWPWAHKAGSECVERVCCSLWPCVGAGEGQWHPEGPFPAVGKAACLTFLKSSLNWSSAGQAVAQYTRLHELSGVWGQCTPSAGCRWCLESQCTCSARRTQQQRC